VRLNFRIAKFGWTFFVMLSRSQRLEGVTSLQSDGDAVGHMVMWDLEGCSLEEAEQTLKQAQQKYNLSHIYIVSDAEGSYRAWCFSKVDFPTFLSILVDSLSILDYSFFYYTVKRRKATLRISDKKDRPPQRLVAVLGSYAAKVPDQMELVVYDTGLVKRGHTIMLGGRDG
jgi:hypothetical protein